jgi:hypothetical protein
LLERPLADFFKCALKSLDSQTDFDSAIPWFESRRPNDGGSLASNYFGCRVAKMQRA